MRRLSVAWKDSRHRPGQSILTGVSLLVGILAVVAIYTAAAIVRDVFVAEEERAHGRAVTVEATATFRSTSESAALAARLDARLGSGAARRVVLAAVPLDASATGSAAAEPATVQTIWTDGDLRAVRRLPMASGRWPSGTALPPEVVVNAAASGVARAGDSLRLGSPLGRSGMTAVVVGVVADGLDEPTLYGNLGSVLTLAPELVTGVPLTVLAHLPHADPGRLGRAVGFAVGDAGGTLTDRPRRVDRIEELERTLRQMQMAFLACAVIALAVSALGILNIGLAGIRERSRELLVRRAVGARRSDLVSLVLLAALFVAAAAMVVGVVIAMLVVEVAVPVMMAEDTALVAPRFPWEAVMAGAIAAVATTLVGATVPAVVASKVDIAEALRV